MLMVLSVLSPFGPFESRLIDGLNGAKWELRNDESFDKSEVTGTRFCRGMLKLGEQNA
jgi:hypothetical protein